MSNKPNKQPKPTRNAPDDPTPENDLENEGEAADGIDSWDEELRDWAEEENSGGRRTVLTAYRLDPEGQEKAKFAFRWQDKIPNPHELGMQCGGGKYRVMLTIEGKRNERKITNRIIWIDSTYDDVREELKAARKAQLTAAGGAAGNDFERALSLIEGMNKAYAPILQRGAAAGTATPTDQYNLLPTIMPQIGTMLRDVFKSQVDVYRDAQKNLIEGRPAAGAAPAENGDLTQKDMIELGIKFIEAAGLKEWMGKVFNKMTAGAAEAGAANG